MTATHYRGHVDRREIIRLDYAASGPSGPQLRITLHDDIDMAVAALLEATLANVRVFPPCDVVVDLADVTFLCSTGLSFLAAVNNHTTAHGHTTTVRSPGPNVRRALQICGFDQALSITG